MFYLPTKALFFNIHSFAKKDILSQSWDLKNLHTKGDIS